MKNYPKNIHEKKGLHKQKDAKLCKKTSCLLALTIMILSHSTIIPLTCATIESPSGNDTLVVEPASKDSITKFLNAGERIAGKITVSGGDNFIYFKLFDPDGNLCLYKNVLQSDDFSWGPVELEGYYKLEFDNWFDPSSTNTVNMEFQIINTLDYQFPTTFAIIIFTVLVIIIIPTAIMLNRRRRKSKLSSGKVVNYTEILSLNEN